MFEDFLDEVEDGASYIVNKIQGALGHGGGIQVAAGTDEYANMERFLALLGEDVGPVTITPETLFDGVKMESARSTLRRAAIIFAGRIPTNEEYESIEAGGLTSIRAAIRGLMKGTEFHEFLIRAANDRLLTDREYQGVLPSSGPFVDFINESHRLATETDSSGDGFNEQFWHSRVQHGAFRAPLEQIAHVVENDLPYTEILTADYVMANPFSAKAYGASTVFEDPSDVFEFKPSDIVSYYRDCEGKVVKNTEHGDFVEDSGPCATDYPHAGLLSTTAFLQRYPTTATNRNRARARWTYYHFLGLDVENSASRTTDPVALADRNNPTMNNPACTVCHEVLDPVAGSFQNFGDTGLYRDQLGGLDSLDEFYKDPDDGVVAAVEATSYDTRDTVAVDLRLWRRGVLYVQFANDFNDDSTGADRNVFVDRLVVRDSMNGDLLFEVELEELTEEDLGEGDCGLSVGDTHFAFWAGCRLRFEVDLPKDGTYRVEAVAWADQAGDELAKLTFGSILYQAGDTWYRDMQVPGFDGTLAPNAENSLQWLAKRVVADPRFAESAVKFWWPTVIGTEFARPPQDQGDSGFEGTLLASNAQVAELVRLATGFRRGFQGASPYNLKDLLVEIVLSPWFRAVSLEEDDPVRSVALNSAGARRLLTPEELARKTLALTGFQWGRFNSPFYWRPVVEHSGSLLMDIHEGYALMYGGIDSAGISDRARDLTSVMSGVAERHALSASCPIVMREFYLLPDNDRRLFGGLDQTVSPVSEFGGIFEIAAGSRADIETLSVEGPLTPGSAVVKLAFLNDFWDEQLGDRNVVLDRVTIRRGASVVDELEMENLAPPQNCHHGIGDDAFTLFESGRECELAIALDVPVEGTYRVDVRAWGDHAGDELPKLQIAVETDVDRSTGSTTIKKKLVDLHEKLLGVRPSIDSPDVDRAFELFVEVWDRKRHSENQEFVGWRDYGYPDGEHVECEWESDQAFLDGIVDGAFDSESRWEEGYGWDWERVDTYFGEVDWYDRLGVAETWTVVLAHLLTDYRYLYL